MSGEINWATVGVSWTLSVATCLILYGFVKAINFCRRRQRRKKKGQQYINNIGSATSDAPQKAVDTVLKDPTRTPIFKSQQEPTSSARPASRRLRDEVVEWCSQHNLPEALARELREGPGRFTTKHALNQLRPEDIPSLSLSTRQLEILLRSALEQRSPTRLTSAGGSTSTASDRNSSPLSAATVPLLSDTETSYTGLLSDAGLHALAKELGCEWRRLGAELGVSRASQDKLRMDSHSTEDAIFNMLRSWRDSTDGSRRQKKDSLYSALTAVERSDLAERVHREVVHGSNRRRRDFTLV